MKILIFLFFISLSASAEHRGGNGGDPFEIGLKIRLLNVAAYIENNPSIFPELQGIPWTKVAKKTSMKVTTKKLKDRFGAERCALNFEEKELIVINKKCLTDSQFSGRVLNSLLAHELLNLRQIESPTNDRSLYFYSERFLNIPDEIVTGKNVAELLVKGCTISLTKSLIYSKVSLAIIKLKGYKVTTSPLSDFMLATDTKWTFSANLSASNGIVFWERTFKNLDENLIELPSCLEI
jgi:hypothetical protein